mmetsp:Transcript_21217/g.29741  ORF Transcript_21217/g.29741 Transcript_21217/m.29741 type:complete len:210 (+) Transcript_21217:129-758(+)
MKNGSLISGGYSVSSSPGSSGLPPLSRGTTPPKQKKESQGDTKKNNFRSSSQRQRPILSIIRSFDSTMKRYLERNELKKLPKLLDLYEKMGFMLDTRNGTLCAEGVLEDLRTKQNLVINSIAWLEYVRNMFVELQDLEPNINCEVPYDAASFEKHLLKAEAAISMQTRRALEIQRAIQEMTLSYNKIMHALTMKLLMLDSESFKVGASR